MSQHFEQVKIETYRGIKGLTTSDLGSINFLVGDNNSGKTSVLEAIQILSDPSDYNIIQVARQREKYKRSMWRGLTELDMFMYMFNISSGMQDTNEYKIELSAILKEEPLNVKIQGEVVEQLINLKEVSKYRILNKNRDSGVIEDQEEIKTFLGKIISSKRSGEQLSLLNNQNETEIEVNNYRRYMRSPNANPLMEVRTLQTIDHVVSDPLSRIIKNKLIKEKAINLLKGFDPTISDLRYIKEDDRFVPVVESDLPEYLPLSMYGDGMKKALAILNALVTAENGVVLIDEFETAVHTSAMENVFKFMISVAKDLNIQLFLTTHSIEAVDKVLECSGDLIDEIRVITLKKDQVSGNTLARNLKGSEVLQDRKNFDFEVRK